MPVVKNNRRRKRISPRPDDSALSLLTPRLENDITDALSGSALSLLAPRLVNDITDALSGSALSPLTPRLCGENGHEVETGAEYGDWRMCLFPVDQQYGWSVRL